jgi:hypothetical protein
MEACCRACFIENGRSGFADCSWSSHPTGRSSSTLSGSKERTCGRIALELQRQRCEGRMKASMVCRMLTEAAESQILANPQQGLVQQPMSIGQPRRVKQQALRAPG